MIKSVLTFRRGYFLGFLLLFLVEFLIAKYLHSGFIRMVVGDYLVVILLYCFFRSFLKISYQKTAIFTLLLAYFIECMQWLNILSLLRIKQNTFTHMTLGSTFDWMDMLSYTIGFISILVVEEILKQRGKSQLL
jgi:hypothetical protein